MFPGTHKAGALLHVQKYDGVVATHAAYEAVTFPLQRQGKEDFLGRAQEGRREALHVSRGLGALALRAGAPSRPPRNSWSGAEARPACLSSQGAASAAATHPAAVRREEQAGDGPRVQREAVQRLPGEEVPPDDAGVPAPGEQPAGCRPAGQHQQGRHAAAAGAAQHAGRGGVCERESGGQRPVPPFCNPGAPAEAGVARRLPLAPERSGQHRMLPEGEPSSRSPRSTPGQPEREAAFLGPGGGRGGGHAHKMPAPWRRPCTCSELEGQEVKLSWTPREPKVAGLEREDALEKELRAKKSQWPCP